MADDAGIYLKQEGILVPGATVPGPKGDKGDQGIQGDPGPANTLAVGTVVSGASASAEITGTSPSQVINFVLQKGDKGETGPIGPTGPANTLTIGTITSVADGGTADASITGSAPYQTLHLTLVAGPTGPKGDQGEPGTGNVNTVNGDLGPDVVLDAADVGAEPAVTAGGTSHYYRGDKTWQTLNKTVVGLSNVDNTSDADKPISTATQTVLDAKADLVNGVIPTTQLPPLAINETFVVASQAAMLALTAQRGDMAIRTDSGRTYVLAAEGASTLSNWAEISAAGDVTSVAGKTGAVSLVKADVGLSNVDNTSDLTKPISTPQTNYVRSRGMNLVANGTALLRNNTNFSVFTYVPTDRPVGSGGSFKVNAVGSSAPEIDELLPIDPTKTYKYQFQIKQLRAGSVGRAYGLISPYDIDGLRISPQHYMYRASTTVQLAQDLTPGDTTINVTGDLTYWNNNAGTSSHWRNIIIWNWVDGTGYAWPKETYSRNVMSNAYADGGVNVATNTITLSSAYAGDTIPAGTWISNGGSGGTYIYTSWNNVVVPNEWTPVSDEFGGIHYMPTTPGSISAASKSFPVGTAFIRVGWLTNREDNTSEHAVANVSFSEVAAGNLSPETITWGHISSTIKNASPSVTSLRSLGFGATEAAPGDKVVTLSSAQTVTGNKDFIGGITARSQLILRADAGDHMYIQFYARTSTSAPRSGFIGYGSVGTNNFTIQNELDGHINLTTVGSGAVNVNGSRVVTTDDSRLTDARTPTAHTHAAADITSGVLATARLGTGTADTTTFLRGDNTWAVVSTGANLARVVHDGTSYPTRPDVEYVEWVGPVEPTAMVSGDSWVNTA